MRTRPNWDTTYMSICSQMAVRSHDVRTQHAAILCNAEHRVLGIGYNGFPKGLKDMLLPDSGEDKYKYIIHAEDNCLRNSRIDFAPPGSTLYVSGHPCLSCFLKIIDYNVKRVVHGGIQSNCVSSEDMEGIDFLRKQAGIDLVPYDDLKSDMGLLESVDWSRQQAKKMLGITV